MIILFLSLKYSAKNEKIRVFMLHAFLFFFLDFLAFAFLSKWVVHSLLVYFIVLQLKKRGEEAFFSFFFCFPLFLLLIQDLFFSGRVGISFVFLLPILFCARQVRFLLIPAIAIFVPIFLIFAMASQDFFIKGWLLGQNIHFYSTIIKIFINIIIGYMVLWCMRGNRSLASFKG